MLNLFCRNVRGGDMRKKRVNYYPVDLNNNGNQRAGLVIKHHMK